MTTAQSNEQDWILNDLVDRVPGTLRAVLVSYDGLPLAWSDGTHRDMAERTAAAISGQQALSRQRADFAGSPDGELELNLAQYRDGAFDITMGAGQGAYLTASGRPGTAVESVSYAMQQAVARLGEVMSVPARKRP
ncbi:roadblock/LC7 domain-containing protein [Kitasatospora sp. NPDC048540]|uniref:roadblock/LC7 domain-containing protein n=1 Tax=Kitasatospora sp. NPDC048540 TaxID=3155634 RepID=UPI0033E3C517